MSQASAIEWTDATWNPVRGCTKVSPGCKNCYAQTFAERWRGVPNHPYEQGFDLRLVPEKVTEPLRWRKARLVFVNSMGDLFHEDVPLDFIRSVFETMASSPQHTFQVLTKRAARLTELAPSLPWPDNVWQGVSVESTDYFKRVELLREVPAIVRFLSLEPLLGPLDGLPLDGIHWVIAGGESGPRFRPVDASWLRGIRDQCVAAQVPFFFKQWGGRSSKSGGRLLDGRIWDEWPTRHSARRTTTVPES